MTRIRIQVCGALLVLVAPALLEGQQRPPEVLEAPRSGLSSPVLTNERLAREERAAEIARLRELLFRRVAYPLRIRQLDSEIRVAEAEVKSLDRQIREYERISRPVANQPFLVTLESSKMRRLAVSERLGYLKHEKLLLLQNFQIERRLRQLEAQ